MANQILAGAVVQAGYIIAGVDASNPPYVGPPVAKWITRSVGAYPKTFGVRSVLDLDSTATTFTNTSDHFGSVIDVDLNGRYIVVRDSHYPSGTGNGAVWVYNAQDLSEEPTILIPDSGESTYNQLYTFGYSLAMSGDKLFVGNNAQGVPVYCYDLSDLSAAPSKISTPTTYHQGDYLFSFDMSANSTHLFIGHPQSREPINSSDNMTEAGAVHVYDAETLSYQTSLFGFEGEYGDKFGSEVKATDTHLAVGAYGDDEVNGNQNQNGAVYIFNTSDLSASPTKVMPLTSGHSDQFGRAISLNDTHLAVSESNDDTNNSNSGALHIYDLNNLPTPTISYGTLYSEYYGSNPVLFNDGSNRISFYRSFANLGQPAKYFVYNINDLDTPLWESETEQVVSFLPAYVAPPPPPPSLTIVISPYNQDEVYVYESSDLTGTPTIISAPDSNDTYFGAGLHSDSDNLYVTSVVNSVPLFYVYDLNDLSATPTTVVPPPTSWSTFGTNSFANEANMFRSVGDKIYISNWETKWGDYTVSGTNRGSGKVFVYDKNDWSAAPITLSSIDQPNGTYHPTYTYNYGLGFGRAIEIYGSNLYVTRSSGGQNAWDTGIFVYDINDLSSPPAFFDLASTTTDLPDQFGTNLIATANNIVISAWMTDVVDGSDKSGAFFVYDRSNLNATPTRITAPTPIDGDRFAHVMAATDSYILASRWDTHTHATNSRNGLVEIYDINTFDHITTISPPAGSIDSSDKLYFGNTFAVSGSELLIAATGDESGGVTNVGSVFVYDINALTASPTQQVLSPSSIQSTSNAQFGSDITITVI